MSKKLIVLLLALGVLIIVSLTGCDKDEATNPDEKLVGDINDPQFLLFEEAMDAPDETSEIMFGLMFEFLDTVDIIHTAAPPPVNSPLSPLLAEADTVFVVYHAGSQYWYRTAQFSEATGSDTLALTLEDSLQFLHAIGPVQWPDSALLVGLNHGALLTIESNTEDTVEAAQWISLTGDIASEGDVTLNGTQSFGIFLTDDAGPCSFALDIATTATNVLLNIAHTDSGGCPSAGVLAQNGTVGIECTGDTTVSFSDTWTITQTFTGNDQYTIVAENSTTRWTYSGSCADEQTKSTFAQRIRQVFNEEL